MLMCGNIQKLTTFQKSIGFCSQGPVGLPGVKGNDGPVGAPGAEGLPGPKGIEGVAGNKVI
jgi:hypothetical protein